MKTRVIMAVVMGLILVPFLFITDTLAFVLLISFLAIRSVYEMLRCLGIHKKWVISVPAYILAVVTPFGARLLGSEKFLCYALPGALLFVIWVYGCFTFCEGSVSLEQAGNTIAMTIYIIFGFTFLVLMTDVEEYGLWLMLTVFIASWVTDTFAYFTGMLLGKHKLCPKISPKKTVEGSLGGILFCAAAFSAYGLILAKFTDISPKFIILPIAGVAASVVSQVGDLLMSSVKRARNIKDYGKIIPGHGGVLDRFDSVLAVSVIMFAIENIIGIFN